MAFRYGFSGKPWLRLLLPGSNLTMRLLRKCRLDCSQICVLSKVKFWFLMPFSFSFSIKGVSFRVRHVIEQLRLKKIYSGTFVKLSPGTLKWLRTVEPYVAWGLVHLWILLCIGEGFNWVKVIRQIYPSTLWFPPFSLQSWKHFSWFLPCSICDLVKEEK